MFRTLDDGCRTIHTMLQSGIVPAAAEIMDRTCLEVVARHRKTDLDPEVDACIIIEIDGDDDAALETQAKRIEEAAKACGAIEFRTAQSQQEADDIWAVRRGISSAVAALAPNRIGEDISVPRDAFPEVVRRIREISEKYGLPDRRVRPCRRRQHPPLHPVRPEQAGGGGAGPSGGRRHLRRGPGRRRDPLRRARHRHHQAALHRRRLGEVGIRTLKAVKAALDPKGILNPGKIW